MCKNERDEEVKEDSGCFILHNKWVRFPYNQKRRRKRFWKDVHVLTQCVPLSFKALENTDKAVENILIGSSWLESAVLKDKSLSLWPGQSYVLLFVVVFSLPTSYTLSWTLISYKANICFWKWRLMTCLLWAYNHEWYCTVETAETVLTSVHVK